MKYRSEVDGLRAIAVIPVILFHAGLSVLSGGFVGVDIFFVISGYLIASIIFSEIQQGNFSIINFYERRARRILPVLFFVMTCSLIAAWFWLLPEDMKDFSQSLVAVASFSSNILFMQESGYWDTANELKPLLHTWSLAVEEQFYILFPLFLLLIWKIRKHWITTFLVILLFIASLSLAHWGAYRIPISTFYLLTARAWELIIGVGIAYYFFSTNDSNRLLLSNNKVNEIASFIGLGMIAYAVLFFDKDTPFPSLYALVPTVGAGLIILFSTSQTLVGRLLSTKIFVGVGLISYGAYLWHQPLLAFTRYSEVSTGEGLKYILIALLSLPLAYISWGLVERPFRKKDKLSRKTIFIFSFIGSVTFFLVGALGHVNNGFPERFPQSILNVYYTNNGSLKRCDEDIFRKSGSTCIIGAQDVAPTSALFGDSHSSKLTKSLGEILKKQNKSMVVYAQAWCPPLIDFGTDNINKVPVCREYMTSSFAKIMKDKKIETVVLAAEWPNYTKGIRPGTDTDQAYYTDEHSVEKSLEENYAAFTRSIDRTLNSLSEKNKKVVFITSVPEYEVNVPIALTKRYLIGEKELPQEYRVTLSEYKKRNKEVFNALINAKESDSIAIINSSSIFCQGEYCDYHDGDLPSYEDSNHLTYEATRLITKELEKLLTSGLNKEEAVQPIDNVVRMKKP